MTEKEWKQRGIEKEAIQERNIMKASVNPLGKWIVEGAKAKDELHDIHCQCGCSVEHMRLTIIYHDASIDYMDSNGNYLAFSVDWGDEITAVLVCKCGRTRQIEIDWKEDFPAVLIMTQ